MSVQYLSDENGHLVAVQLPIEEWEKLKLKYPDLDAANFTLPDWQKQLIDDRLKTIKETQTVFYLSIACLPN